MSDFDNDLNKCCAKVYDPFMLSYNELKNKLDQFEAEKKKEIDKLWNETIGPLQDKIQQQDIKLNNSFKTDLTNFQRIKDLERVIEKQNIVISMAAGYISSTPQFSNDHPINVKKWLMGGME